MRQSLAEEAARIMRESGITDWRHALRKAAHRWQVANRNLWPVGEEVYWALETQQRLFQGAEHHQVLMRQRTQALAVLRNFADFQPRLIGPLAHGAVLTQTPIRVLLFSDETESLIRRLIDHAIPWQDRTIHLHFADGREMACPCLEMLAGQDHIQLIVMPLRSRHQYPLDEISRRPMRGLQQSELEVLIAQDKNAPIQTSLHPL